MRTLTIKDMLTICKGIEKEFGPDCKIVHMAHSPVSVGKHKHGFGYVRVEDSSGYSHLRVFPYKIED